jgi:hypothetical protein
MSPFIHEFFVVKVSGWRGMAYCGEDGKWRDAYQHEQLVGEVRIIC